MTYILHPCQCKYVSHLHAPAVGCGLETWCFPCLLLPALLHMGRWHPHVAVGFATLLRSCVLGRWRCGSSWWGQRSSGHPAAFRGCLPRVAHSRSCGRRGAGSAPGAGSPRAGGGLRGEVAHACLQEGACLGLDTFGSVQHFPRERTLAPPQ